MRQPDGCAPSRSEWQEFLRLVDTRLATRINSYRLEAGPFTDRISPPHSSSLRVLAGEVLQADWTRTIPHQRFR